MYGRGQKIADLRRNLTTTVLVDTGQAWRELEGIMLRRGVAVPYAASAAGRSRRWVDFTPTTSVSWNNEKLP